MLIKMREMMRKKDNQKGFTLVELIVVMAILAVLAALAVPRFGGVLGDSKEKARDADIEMITRAAEMYIANETDAATTLVDGAITADTHVLIDRDYLKGVPTDPVTGHTYTLDVTVTGGQITEIEVTVTP